MVIQSLWASMTYDLLSHTCFVTDKLPSYAEICIALLATHKVVRLTFPLHNRYY